MSVLFISLAIVSSMVKDQEKKSAGVGNRFADFQSLDIVGGVYKCKTPADRLTAQMQVLS